MNKLMLSAAAVALTLAASPAIAADDSGVKLNLGGYFKGYANYTNEDNVHSLDIIRDTEVHFGGETTLDNGLTVGAHIEAEADGEDGFGTDESYVYFAGSWGRANFGVEDGAAYLLQVAAPSADDNIDGIRQTINPYAMGSVDYANDQTRGADKLTYLSPVFSGFQAGASYTPQAADITTLGAVASRGALGNSTDSDLGEYDGAWELAARYEGMVSNVGVILGAGYTHASNETDGAVSVDVDGDGINDLGPFALDDFSEWNVGLDLDIGAFGVGAAYTESNLGVDANEDWETVVLGADYTTGPFKVGASYLNSEVDSVVELERYTAGVVYTYGPGMSFRGSLGYQDEDVSDVDATVVSVGTQINF